MTTVVGPEKIRTCSLSLPNLILLAHEGRTRVEGMGPMVCKTEYVLIILHATGTHKKTWLMNRDT